MNYNRSNTAALKKIGENFWISNCIESMFIINNEDIFSQVWPETSEPNGFLQKRRSGPVLDTRMYQNYQEIRI